MRGNGNTRKYRARLSHALSRSRSYDSAVSLRIELALALYPRYLDFMEGGSDDDLPPYGYDSAAGDAVRAADYLITALEESAIGEGER